MNTKSIDFTLTKYDYVIEVGIDGRIAAYAGLNSYNKNTLLIEPILVDSKYRGNGIGSKILDKAEKLAKDGDYKRIAAYTLYEDVANFFENNNYIVQFDSEMKFFTAEKNLESDNNE